MRRRLALGLLALLLIASCWGCARYGTKVEGEDLPSYYEHVIGVSQANLVEPWRIAVYGAFQLEAQAYPNTRLVFTDAASDSQRQREDIARLLELGIDLLIVSPNDAAELREAIESAQRRVPVIVLDRDVPGQPYSLFIGPDNERIGRMAGRRVAELLSAEGGQVLELTGRADSPPTIELSRGFHEVIQEHPNIEIVHTIDANWFKDAAAGEMKNFLIEKAYFEGSDPIQLAVFAHNDAMALGAYETVKINAVKGATIHYIGVDGLPDFGKKYVSEGIFDATFSRPTGAKEALRCADDILRGESMEKKQILLEPTIILP